MVADSFDLEAQKKPRSRHLVALIILLILAVIGVVIGLIIALVQRDDLQQQVNDLHANGLSPLQQSTSRAPSTSPLYPYISEYRFAAVASDTNLCSSIGTDIMAKKGGSAVDGAIATLICMGLANAMSCGIGGGHFMTVYIRAEKKAYAIVAREIAPAEASANMFDNVSSTEGGKAIGVPGEILGMHEAHSRFGRLNWTDLFGPSIKLCREGIPVSIPLQTAIDDSNKNGYLDRYENLRLLLTNPVTNKTYRAGEKMKRPQLADTLETIAREGAKSFYNGSLSSVIAHEVQEAGGIITDQDLANYTALVKDTVLSTISVGNRTLYVHSPPLPSTGIVYQYILNILNGYNFTPADLATTESKIRTYHRIIEAFKFAYAKRTIMGDPDVEDQNFQNYMRETVRNMTSSVYSETIRKQITDDTTQGPDYYGPVFSIVDDHGTAHLSVLAPNGDAVSLTSTVNLYFGSKVVGNKTGIIYNDEMDDFSSPNKINYFGVPPSEANFIKPGKRPLSSTCPSVVTDVNGDVVLVAGASGGTRITTATALVTILTAWLGLDVREAILLKRFHHQLYPTELAIETGFPEDIRQGLLQLGHNISAPAGAGCVIQAVENENGVVTAYSDPRKYGKPDGY